LRNRSKPKLGQNFLNDDAAAQRIVAALGDISRHTVIEIGPGGGALTGTLAAKAGRLLAIELDSELAADLRTRFAPDKVTIVEQDALSFDFATAANAAGERLVVAGNLPYGITSQILLKLAASHAALDRAVLMLQREVADRVVAHPHSRDYGLLSVTVQMYGPVERLFTLPPSAFTPPPDVYSTVFRWRFAPRFAELHVEEQGFLRLARQAFAQKRKTLANNLRAAGVAPAAVSAALAHPQIPAQARAEELSLEELANLWRALQENDPAHAYPE
jgi:16S rRNA (adenine1518-N6/adenine1519-N6)-dimethyltransferase